LCNFNVSSRNKK